MLRSATTVVLAAPMLVGCAAQHAAKPVLVAEQVRDAPLPATQISEEFSRVDYAEEWVRLNEQAIPPEGRLPGAENSWPLFVQWFKDFRREEALAFGWSPTEREPFSQQSPDEYQESSFCLLYESHGPFDEKAIAVRREAMAALERLDNTDLFPRLGRLAAMKRVLRSKAASPTLADADFSELRGVRGAIRGIAARLALRLETGDLRGATECLEHGLAIARVARYEPTLLGAFTASACESLMIETLVSRWPTNPCPTLEVDRAARILQDHVERSPPWSYTIRADHVMALDAIQSTYSPFGREDTPTPSQIISTVGTAADMDDAQAEEAQTLVQGFKVRSDTVELANRLFTLAAQAIDTPRFLREMEPLNQAEMEAEKNLILGVVMPNFAAAFSSADAQRTQVSGVRLMLAVEQHRLVHDSLPNQLSDLVPEFLDAIPHDPFSERGFRYRRVDASESQRGYVLYSVGRDGEDNGGLRAPGSNVWALTAHNGAGYDYVVVGSYVPVAK